MSARVEFTFLSPESRLKITDMRKPTKQDIGQFVGCLALIIGAIASLFAGVALLALMLKFAFWTLRIEF